MNIFAWIWLAILSLGLIWLVYRELRWIGMSKRNTDEQAKELFDELEEALKGVKTAKEGEKIANEIMKKHGFRGEVIITKKNKKSNVKGVY